MGWNSYNHFRLKIDDKTIREVADAISANGMKDAGYVYINIDDGWQGKRNDKGELEPHSGFPDMKSLADYVHSKGLKVGIYSSPGPRTCGQFVGSYGYEEQDAKMFARWGMDYLKYDWCSASRMFQPSQMRPVYQLMGQALQATGRPIVYALCQYGRESVEEWGPKVGGNVWRTTFDIRDTWQSMVQIGFSQNGREKAAGPGRWNDPDMLEVGNGGMSQTEYKTHFSLWSMLAAPLLAGHDPRSMSPEIKEILLNKEVIAVNQDKLGKQGYRAAKNGDTEVWLKPLNGGEWAVALFNLGAAAAPVEAPLPEGKWRLRDLWAAQDLGIKSGVFSAEVPSHGVVMLRAKR
jgi:alpha-galactosidase